MKSVIYILSFFSSITVWGQDSREIYEDFNGDGHIDTLISWYTGGSGFGGRYCELTNGLTNEKYEINTEVCFCQIKHVILIPPVLRKEENKPLLETIEKEILPEFRKSPDPSLKWIISAKNTYLRITESVYFDMILSVPADWQDGPLTLPGTYYINLKGKAFDQLYEPEEYPPWYDQEGSHGWLIYYGHNHYRNPEGDSITLAAKSQSYQAYKTSHGLVVKKGKSFAWVFVTDYDLLGGPEKLRWESIKNVWIRENHIIVEQERPPDGTNNIFVIDIENGICGRLKITTDTFSPTIIKNSNLIVEDIDGKKSYNLDNIFKELSVLHKE